MPPVVGRSGRDAFPELFDAIEERFRARRMSGAVVAETGFEFFEQFALTFAELHRSFDHDAADQIADVAVAHVAHAFASQPERFAGLRFGGNLDGKRAAP